MQINEVPNAKVGIVAGSKSDQETVDKITAVLDQFEGKFYRKDIGKKGLARLANK